MNKIKHILNFFIFYHKIFFSVVFYEIYYSLRFSDFLPKIKIQKKLLITNTVPCIYYFLHKISIFVKKRKIKSVIDIGSGYGRAVNFITTVNRIRSYGIELDKEVYLKSLRLKKKNVVLFNDDVFKFNFKKLKSTCYILNDPFGSPYLLNKFLLKIIKINNKKKYFIVINSKNKIFPKEWNLIHSINASKTRSLKIFEINPN